MKIIIRRRLPFYKKTFYVQKESIFLYYFLSNVITTIAQVNSFDWFTYTPPDFFTKNKIPYGVQWSMKIMILVFAP